MRWDVCRPVKQKWLNSANWLNAARNVVELAENNQDEEKGAKFTMSNYQLTNGIWEWGIEHGSYNPLAPF